MLFRSVLLLAGVMSLSGCVTAAVGAAGAVGITAMQDKTLGEGLDDASASNELKARLMASDPKAFNEVDVEVAGRIALLTGRVPTEQNRLDAERIAWSVGLIQDVGNEIKVREPGGLRQNANDEWITARVRTRLLTDSAVKSMNINIETYDGVVYLMGVARTPAELQRAAELTSYVNGVREVVSYITVRDPQAARYSQNRLNSPSNPYQPATN